MALVAFSRIPGVASRNCGEEITQKRGDDHLDYGDGWSLRRHFTTNFPGLDIRAFATSNDLGSMAILLLAFFATSAIRIAQGSATVAMITSVGIVGGLVSQGFGVHPVYLALAIGCGAKPVPWMNDSGFWVVGKLSGLTEKETLQTFSVVIALQGIVGMLAVLVFAYFFPGFLF